jgi:hypothetical protein
MMRPQEPMPRLLRSGGAISPRPPQPQPARRPLPTGEEESLVATAELDWREIPQTRPDLSQTLPQDAALLKVVPTSVDGEECFRLELYYRNRILVTAAPEMLKRQRRPMVVLADTLDGQTSTDNVVRCYTVLRNWSDTKYELTRWLTTLRQEVGSDLRLIIWDDTDFGIQWELFWHGMDEDPGWLGASVQLIRWTTVHDPGRHDQFSAETGATDGRHVLYYEDSALAVTVSIQPDGQPGYKAARTMEELLTELAGPSNYGLVYIRGHGAHDTDLFKAKLAGVCLADFAGRSMPGLRRARAVVFLNACNSARPVVDKSLGDEGNRNFAEVFLRQRATGVIATMAEVPVGHAVALARRLVTQARTDGVAVPEYLRAHRVRYARRLPEHTMNLTDEDRLAIVHFVYASMFAYFGHPDSVFKLAEP